MVLQLLDVTRTYGAQRALDGVSIHVRRGDCYAFIGHNGAGKTTAMRIALGLDRGFGGRVLIDGFDASAHPREARARMGGLIEVPGFHGALDGAKNLVFLAQLQGLPRHEARREAGRLIELVGLSQAGPKPVAAYSQGMRQRLGIAQALIGRPMCVLLDEPTNGLDPQGIAEMQALFRRLTRDEGLTVMLSSHHLAQLSGLVNRVGVLHHGRLLVEAPTVELLGEANGRYKLELESAEGPALQRALEPLGVGTLASPGGGVRLEIGTRAPSAVLRALVQGGLAVRSFAPDPPSLEEIYLQHAQRANDRPLPGGGARAAVGTATASRPGARLAPSAPVARVVRYELERVWSRGKLVLLLSLPAALALASVLRLHAQSESLAEEVRRGQLFSTTEVTAFQATGGALQAGLPLCGALAVGLATQAIAGELSRGTLRNLLLRPLTRVQAAFGKLAAQLALVAGSYALLAGTALAAAACFFDFHGVAEILPDGQRYDLVAAEELVPELRRALAAPLLPLIAYSALGLFAGALARGAAAALALGLGLYALLDLTRTVARGFGLEGFLPSAYLPSPLGDTSFLAYYADVAQGVSNAHFDFAASAVAAPVAWAALALASAVYLLARRSVP
ncbi:MAG TPA: ATP-binding cassette domain-containing protein [Myxococcota bacterium]|nr:ATP-binding cassette domain-containing protein [Myxococcota bacterium]